MSAILMACKSAPATEPSAAEDILVPAVSNGPVAVSVAVSQEVYDFTLAEIRLFINNLNSLINDKNYSGWRNLLSNEFYAAISSPEFLARASESALLKSRKIVLKTPNDYFLQVVVPSRSNSQVDEIEFTSGNTVKVYYLERTRKTDNNTDTVEVRRLRLYELFKSKNEWKIIN